MSLTLCPMLTIFTIELYYALSNGEQWTYIKILFLLILYAHVAHLTLYLKLNSSSHWQLVCWILFNSSLALFFVVRCTILVVWLLVSFCSSIVLYIIHNNNLFAEFIRIQFIVPIKMNEWEIGILLLLIRPAIRHQTYWII